MAISKGKESLEGAAFKRYIGVAPCFVKAVNPNKKESEEIFGNVLETEPKYTGEADIDGQKVPNVRITFIVHPDPEKTGFDAGNLTLSFFLQKRVRYNGSKTKVQVIDKYGRTAWVTVEQAKAHEIPVYSNGPANIDKGYRPAYVGEEDLTNFLIAYLNIPQVMKYNQAEGTWYMVDDPVQSECRLDHIEDYFKGNFKELSDAIKFQPMNKVKILFGVRTNDEGKQFQAAYTQKFLRNSVSDLSKLDKDVQERKQAGAYASTEFEVVPLKEYVVESTKIKDTLSEELPFEPGW